MMGSLPCSLASVSFLNKKWGKRIPKVGKGGNQQPYLRTEIQWTKEKEHEWEKTEWGLRKTEHILGHLLHKYELTILIWLFKGCEYGDKTNCSVVTSRSSCYLNGDDCCETCAPYVTNITSKITYPIKRIYLINIHTAKPSHFISTFCKRWYFLAKF